MCFWYVFLVFISVFILSAFEGCHKVIDNNLRKTFSLLQITTVLPYFIIYLFFSVNFKGTVIFNHLDHIRINGK